MCSTLALNRIVITVLHTLTIEKVHYPGMPG